MIKILENYTFDLASKVKGFSRVTLKNPSHFSTAWGFKGLKANIENLSRVMFLRILNQTLVFLNTILAQNK